MGPTSNESKQRYNAAHYAQVKVSVMPEIAASFKARCSAEGTSMASELSRFMSGQSGAAPAKRLPASITATRRHRRKAVEKIVRQLEAIMSAEQDYMSNIPENLQGSSVYETAEQTLSELEDAIDILSGAY